MACVFGAVVAVAACSSKDDAKGVGGTEADAHVLDSSADSALKSDTSDALSPACAGACLQTALEINIGGKKRALDRAQLGTQRNDAGRAQLHVEAHSGGMPECPTQTSATPTYTLIVNGVPRGAPGGQASKSDGVTSAFFDFKGDLGLPPLTKATSVSITSLVEDPATPPAWSAFDITAVFPEGAVTGHIYAPYCLSLSD